MGKKSQKLWAMLRSFVRGRWGWTIDFVLVPALLFASVLLPPVSAHERIQERDYTVIGPEGGAVLDPDGTQLTIPSGAVRTPIKVRLTSVPRLYFLEGSAGKELLKAAESIPASLVMKSPLYRIGLRGEEPQASILTVPIPNDAEPHYTLDLYTWTGREWQRLPSQRIPEDELLEARLDFLPRMVAVMQTQAVFPSLSVEVREGEKAAEGEMPFTELNPQGIYLCSDGTIGGQVSLAPDPQAPYVVIPTLRNRTREGGVDSDLLNVMMGAGEWRERIANSITRWVLEEGYPGIEVAFEGISPNLREEFSLFIRLLANKLHEHGKLLAVRVGFPVQIAEDRWDTGAYDWQVIGQVADSVRITASPDPRSWAPGGQMEALLSWAVGQVDRYKLKVVLSTYSHEQVGRDFRETPYVKAVASLSSISVEEGREALQPGEEVTLSLTSLSGLKYDDASGAYCFSYRDEEGRQRTLWLEGPTSLTRKLELVARYHLAGVVVYGLLEGDNIPDAWEVLNRYRELALQPPEEKLAVVWKVEGEEGPLAETVTSLNQAQYVWQAPQEPGQYAVVAALSPDGGHTVAGSASVMLEVIAPTPTPMPTPTPRPTPTPKPKPKPKPRLSYAPPPAVAGTGFGYGIQVHPWDVDLNPVMNAVKSLGFGWIKAQVEWKVFESAKGQINWAPLDHLVNTCHAHGIKVLLSVVKAPKWARPPGDTHEGPPANFQDYADFVAAIARRYGHTKVQAIEVWNEQNLYYEWGGRGGKLSAQRYMELLKLAYNAIKAVDPNIIVVSGALTPTGWNDGDIAIDDQVYLQQMYNYGLKRYSDAIGAHPSGYNCPADADWRTVQDPTAGFRGPFDSRHPSFCFRGTMEGYRNIMVANGDARKRIWVTEFGWASVDGLGVPPAPGYEYAADNTEQEQAQWIVRAYELGKSWGWVGVMFLWNLNFSTVTGPADEKAAFSIVRPDWSPRPAFAALAHMPK